MCKYKVDDQVLMNDSNQVYVVTAVHPGSGGSECTYDLQVQGGGATQNAVPEGGLKPAGE